MMETVVCPSFKVAKALTRLSAFYAIWEKNQRHPFAPIRSTALFAKTHGLVIHDRTLNFDCQGRF